MKMILDPGIETECWETQRESDDALYRSQIGYLVAHSEFYRDRLAEAGIRSAEEAGGLADITALPLTGKSELRDAMETGLGLGPHVAVPRQKIARIYSTSGTTGEPSYVPLTATDLKNWIRISMRSYAASGVEAGEAIVTTYGAGPFVAGATLEAFQGLGLTLVPLGPGNTERLMAAVQVLGPEAIALTPSYALHLAEWAGEHGVDLAASSVRRLLVAGEPGGGEAPLRAELEAKWGARVTEAMGIGDIAVSLFGECEAQDGMHFSGRGLVHMELIEPESGEPVALEDGASGELVLTHLKAEAAPMLRFRTRDHVVVRMGTCSCGRTAPRIRCVGRTDDMLIVRGVNVFPGAIREVVARFSPLVTGVIMVEPRARGVKQPAPLPVTVEGAGPGADQTLAAEIAQAIRDRLMVSAEVRLVPPHSLPRSTYKSRLVDFTNAGN